MRLFSKETLVLTKKVVIYLMANLSVLCSCWALVVQNLDILRHLRVTWFMYLQFLQESTGITDTDFVSYVHEWRKAGAQLIGGCCRTTPNTIGAISKALHEH